MAPVSNPDKDMDGGDCGERVYSAQCLFVYRILIQLLQTGSLLNTCNDGANII